MWLRQFFVVFLLHNLQTVKVSCENGYSLAFVIDNTRTMGLVFDDIKKIAEMLLELLEENNKIENLLLVTINDPDTDLVTITNSTSAFKEKLQATRIFRSKDNNECAEMSMSGVQKAANYSQPGSNIFVFTDAVAKDYHLADTVKYMCQKKQIKVNFILTGDCGDFLSEGYKVYYDIAEATSGLLFRSKVNEVFKMLTVVRDLLDDKNFVIERKVLPPSYSWQKVAFNVDACTDEVLIFSNALNVQMHITDTPSLLFGEKQKLQPVLWNHSGKVGKMIHPKPGTYYAWVNGSTPISVVVYAKSNFNFDYGFSTQDGVRSLKHTSRLPFNNSDIWPKLGKGEKLDHRTMMHLFEISQRLYIQTTNSYVKAEYAHIVDMNGKILTRLGFNSINDTFYVTPSFVVPACMFNIKIFCFKKPNNELIIRSSKTPIEAPPKEKDDRANGLPRLEIIETQRNFTYGSTAEFTCKVESNDKPYIQWADERGAIWENMPTQISATDYFIRLKITQMSKSAVYTCSAKNSVGVTKENISINVTSPFIVRQSPDTMITILYGETRNVSCAIESKYPFKIMWYHEHYDTKLTRRTVVPSDKFSIAPDGTKLTIESMDLDLVGKYICEASLISDPRARISYETNVNITGLEKPEIVSTHSVVSGNKYVAICRVKGIPKPVISWLFKPTNSEIFHTIAGRYSEELNISELSPKDSGTYSCVVKNAVGVTDNDFKPIEESKPEVNIIEGAKVIADYDSEVILTCKVNAHPKPIINWSTSSGKGLLPLQELKVNNTEYTSQLGFLADNNETYTCEATNTKGSSNKKVQVGIRPIFRTESTPPASMNVKYGEKVKIACKIKSAFPMKINWYKSGKKNNDTMMYDISTDQTELTIKYMSLGMQGNYTCAAYLTADPSHRIQFNTTLQIGGLEVPSIEPSDTSVNIMKGEKFELKCKIVKGYPQPHVTWNTREGDHIIKRSDKNGAVLTVEKALLTDTGLYGCEARNVLGATWELFDVTVRGLPEVKVNETQINSTYGSNVELSCSIESYIQPVITWTDEKGKVIDNNHTQISEFYYNSQLKLINVTRSTNYTCAAQNYIGMAQARVDLNVSSPFEVGNGGLIEIAYETAETIECEIKSSKPMRIKWYRHNTETKSFRTAVVPSDKLSISPDGTKLIIKSMDLGICGNYTCEASLVSYPEEKASVNITIEVTGLEMPSIEPSDTSVNIMKGEKFQLICKIVKGYPQPHVTWNTREGDHIIKRSDKNGAVLTVEKALLSDTGLYGCEARNVVGATWELFDVTVRGPPEVKVNETQINSAYGSNVELSCSIESYIQPVITWTDEKGKVIENNHTQISEFSYNSQLKLINVTRSTNYTCAAQNYIGMAQARVDLNVSSPFEVGNGGLIEIAYETAETIECEIKSSKPMRIKWYRHNTETKSFRTAVVPSDKLSISPDGTKLIIKSMDLGIRGNYTCEASLVSYPEEKASVNITIEVTGLEMPSIEPSDTSVNIMKGEKFQLICKIVKGYPQPHVTWNTREGDHIIKRSDKNGAVLTVEKALLSDTGLYGCEARNVVGATWELFDVTVRGPPEVKVNETQINSAYGSNVELSCSIESYIQPVITWTDEKGKVIENNHTQISEFYYNSQLKLINVTRSTNYTCAAQNYIGMAQARVDLNVSSPFEVGNGGLIEIAYETSETIECEIKSSKPMRIKWYRHNTETKSFRTAVVPSDKLSISSDDTKLIIKSMDLDLKGKYICEASLVSDPEVKASFNISIKITGLSAPEIISLYSSPVIKDIPLIIKCRVKGAPKPTISWLFKPKSSATFHKIIGSEKVLKIHKLSDEKIGTYRCAANNTFGEDSRDININPIEKRKKEEEEEEEEKKENNESDNKDISTSDDASGPNGPSGAPPIIPFVPGVFPIISLIGDSLLPIIVGGVTVLGNTAVPLFFWKKDGKPIEKSPKYVFKDNGLYIANLTSKDTGNYTCEVVYKSGSAEITFQVNVVDEFETTNEDLKGDTNSVYVYKKDPVTMDCQSSSNTSTSLPRWYLNGKYTNYAGNSYRIANVSNENSGIYTCRTDTNEGATSESFDLNVGFDPYFVYEEYSTDIEGALDCIVESDPEAKVQWFRNGVIIPTSNNTSEYLVNKWGEYKCNASNGFGSIERTFKVSSNDCYVNEHMTTENMPLWFYEDSSTLPYSSASITLAANKSIVLACTSNDAIPNTFQEFPTNNSITAKCYKEDMFMVDGKIFNFSKLQCKAKVEPTILNTHEECSGPQTEMIQVGFMLESFLEIYKICYDNCDKTPIFGSASIMINDFAKKEQSLFKWNQTLKEADGNSTEDYNYLNASDCGYIKSQLVTVDEVSFGPAQAATLNDVLNSIVVWVPCDRDSQVSTVYMSWETFQSKVKAWSAVANKLKIWTGASDYGIKDDEIVSRYLWKVINNNEDFSVVVYINNPEPIPEDVRCSSSCESLTMLDLEIEAAMYFYCCSLDEFSKAFSVTSFNKDTLVLSSS